MAVNRTVVLSALDDAIATLDDSPAPGGSAKVWGVDEVEEAAATALEDIADIETELRTFHDLSASAAARAFNPLQCCARVRDHIASMVSEIRIRGTGGGLANQDFAHAERRRAVEQLKGIETSFRGGGAVDFTTA